MHYSIKIKWIKRSLAAITVTGRHAFRCRFLAALEEIKEFRVELIACGAVNSTKIVVPHFLVSAPVLK